MFNAHTITEDIKRAWYAALSEFFVGGQRKAVQGFDIFFPDCSIYFDVRQVASSPNATKPIIGIVGTRGRTTTFKCSQNGIPGILSQSTCTRQVYVKTILKSPMQDGEGNAIDPRLLADQIWSLLATVINSKQSLLIEQMIRHARLDDFPSDISNDKEVILSGQLSFTVDSFVWAE